MSRALACLVLAAVGATMTPQDLRGQAPRPVAPPVADRTPLLTNNRALQASIDRIAARSALWRQGVAAASRLGRRAVLLTPDQVVVADTAQGRTRPFDPTLLAEAAPMPGEHGRVEAVLVVINLPLLREMHDRRMSLPVDVDADLDRVIVHEVYGHAVPYLLAGDLSGRCADPRPGERALDACAIQRENAVRAELGLGRRLDYGLSGLAIARGDRR